MIKNQLVRIFDRFKKKEIEKAKAEYKKYQVKTISPVEKEYLKALKQISNKIDKKDKEVL